MSDATYYIGLMSGTSVDAADAAAWTMVASALLNMDPFLVRS